MNVHSKYDTDESEIKPQKPRYLKIGYGGPNTGGRSGFGVDGALGVQVQLPAAPGLFDSIFEVLGVKKKKRRRSEGDE